MIEQKARLVVAASGVTQGAVGTGGTFIQIIVAILSGLLGQMKGCGLPTGAAAKAAANPSLFDRLVIRRHVRQHLADQPTFAVFGQQIIQGVLAAGASTTEDEIAAMYEEVS
jgi:hypothetical protein